MGLVDTVIALAIPMKNGKTAVMVDIVGQSLLASCPPYFSAIPLTGISAQVYQRIRISLRQMCS